ncbi:Ig-like domain-containing protein [Candidatus Uhrbacteria bacterium]|nr:Ig-like domain-containing protein [Candidatus Uhrbacteria bacterium]
MNQDQNAQNLDQALKHPAADCHDPALSPLMQTAESLKREAVADEVHLDKEVAAKQRANLMSMVNGKRIQASGADAPSAKQEVRGTGSIRSIFDTKNWFVWTGGLATVAIAVVLAVLVFKPPMDNVGPQSVALTGTAIARLIIPEAHAADAFSVIALEKDRTGVDIATGFMVSSTVPVTTAELVQHLRIVPAADDPDAVKPGNVKVVETSKGIFNVTPDVVLTPGKVYRVVIDTAVKKADGTLTAHDFAWAVQTKSVFRVMTSVPADRSSSVPINTGIEFGMSFDGWTDPTPFFVIEPATAGRFEVHGRSLTFVPLQPLQYGQVYTVTLKKGLNVKDTDNRLAEDFVISFETMAKPKPGEEPGRKPYLSPTQDMNDELPGHDALIPVYWNGEATSTPVTITGYALELDQARQYLVERSKIPDFAIVTLSKDELYAKYTTGKSFTVSGNIEQNSYYGYNIRLPGGLTAGHYLLKFETAGADPSWTFFSSTNLVSYSIADKTNLAVWAVNAETRRPLTDLPVSSDDAQAKTGSDGIAKLPTPQVLTATSSDYATSAIVTLGTGQLSSLIRVQKQYQPYDYFDRYIQVGNMNDQTVSFLYPDRPLYRTTDGLKAYGMARDRVSKQPVSGNLTLELARGGYYFDFFTGTPKIYQRIDLKTDDQGFFQTDLSWKTMQAGTYRINLKRDGQTIASRNFEIRDFVKPAYTLEVVVSKKQIFAGDDISGEVRAKFYSGAPVSNLNLSLNSSGVTNDSLDLKTDDDGRATFTIKTSADNCDAYARYAYCNSTRTSWITVRPTDAEEAQVEAAETVSVWRSHVSLDVTRKIKDRQVDIEFIARKVDLTNVGNSGSNVLGEAQRNAKITGKIRERSWVQVFQETGYDYVQKTSYPIYRYELRERDVSDINVTTDESGKASLRFTMTSTTVSYQLVAETKDENGLRDFATTYFSAGWWDYSDSAPGSDEEISLKPLRDDPQKSDYAAGETVGVGLFKGSDPMPTADTPVYLFVRSHLGIKELAVGQKSTYSFVFDEDSLPNTTVRGITFVKNGFVMRDFTASFDAASRELTVNITPDQEVYAPQGKAKLHVSLKTKDGSPAKGARIDLALVDEAVFAAAQNSIEENPLGDIYSWVSDGVIFDRISQYENKLEAAALGGAERGGGGGEQVRRDFKDTAGFAMVTADDNGQADVTFDLPDNLTSWRATAVAATPGLYAGVGRTQIRVTKPVFVEVTVPSNLLTADKPVMKLRAYGTGLKTGESVDFSIDAPTLGLKNESVKGTVGQAAYVAVDTLPAGNHAMVIRVKGANGTDALEKKINVAASHFLRNDLAQVDLGPGVALPDIGDSREVELRFLPKTRAQYLDRVRQLTWNWSQRFESRLAARLAKALLKDYFGESVEDQSEPLTKYQRPDGGIAILPYASDDAELTSKVAAVAPDLFDRQGLEQYLIGYLQKDGVTREEQIRALSGLAALGAPVLQQLQDMAVLPDLSWREKLGVMRGLNAIGDKQGAKVLLDNLLAQAKEEDGLLSVRIADDKRSVTEATAEAALVAADIFHPAAPKLDAWLEKNWTQDTMTDLDRVAYLNRVVPAALGSDVSFGYTLGGSPEKTITLKESWGYTLVLTADEARSFHVTKVDGPAVAVFYRSVPGLPTANPDIQIARTYQAVGSESSAAFKESDVIQVNLDLKWDKLAQSGCYTVRDNLPAGLAPMVTVYFGWSGDFGNLWYPTDITDNSVSFVTCNPGKQDGSTEKIKYRARVVARGTYLAEPAIMQSTEAPSVSALSQSQPVSIK